MNRIISIVVMTLASLAIAFGGLALVFFVRRAWTEGIDTQQLPRMVFEFAFYSLFVLVGIKAARFANRKSSESNALAEREPSYPANGQLNDTVDLEELDVTWLRATAVWWSVTWRSAVASFAAAIFLSFVVSGLAGGMGKLDLAEQLGTVIGFLVAIPAGVWAVKAVLSREYRHYRIALVPSLEARIEKVVSKESA
jgi:hypothetical protein